MTSPDPRRRALLTGFIALAGLGLGITQVLVATAVGNHRLHGGAILPLWVLLLGSLPATRWNDRKGKAPFLGRPLGIAVREYPEPAFVIPARRRTAVFAALMWWLAAWCGAFVLGPGWDHTTTVPPWQVAVEQLPALLLAICAAWLTVMLFAGRPRLTFYRDRLEFHGLLRTTVVPWAAFGTGVTRWTDAPLGSRVASAFLRYPVQRPELVSGRWPQRGPVLALPHEQLALSTKFLADAVVEYVLCPQYRAGIGTQAEARRFTEQREALVAAYPSPASVR